MARLSEIYYNIDESCFKFDYDDMTFYFSSLFYLQKFEKEYALFIKDETLKLNLRFDANIECDYLILLSLYKKIEKRGFRVYYNNSRLTNPSFTILINN